MSILDENSPMIEIVSFQLNFYIMLSYYYFVFFSFQPGGCEPIRDDESCGDDDDTNENEDIDNGVVSVTASMEAIGPNAVHDKLAQQSDTQPHDTDKNENMSVDIPDDEQPVSTKKPLKEKAKKPPVVLGDQKDIKIIKHFYEKEMTSNPIDVEELNEVDDGQYIDRQLRQVKDLKHWLYIHQQIQNVIFQCWVVAPSPEQLAQFSHDNLASMSAAYYHPYTSSSQHVR
jgi:hypothetical protein